MTTIVDRRTTDKNTSARNKKRFLERHKKAIHKSVKKTIHSKKISDIDKEGATVTIDGDELYEPTFRNKPGTGKRTVVAPGNRKYHKGDQIQKPNSGGGRGTEGSDEGGGEDDFTFRVSKEDFIKLMFDDLELPDLIKKQLTEDTLKEYKLSGFIKDGNPSQLNVKKTLTNALARRNILNKLLEKRVKECTKQLKKEKDKEKKKELKEKIDEAKHLLSKIMYIEDCDLRYDLYLPTPKFKYKAVMFCVMDVSGSMGDFEKDLAKRFFLLLYMFLSKNYKDVELVFIRHTQEAQEVDEDTFFYSTETGGTLMSSAIELANNIVDQRYPSSEWDCYLTQCSDGDNFTSDNNKYIACLTELLPKLQYAAYIQISHNHFYTFLSMESEVWDLLTRIAEHFNNFNIRKIKKKTDIFKVFESLFQKRDKSE